MPAQKMPPASGIFYMRSEFSLEIVNIHVNEVIIHMNLIEKCED